MATIYIDGVKAKLMAIGTTEIANILKGTSDPSSSIGSDGQLYLKYIKGTKQDFSDFNFLNESSMKLFNLENETEFIFTGGSAIGGQYYAQVDLTGIDSIQVTIDSFGDSYDNYNTPRFAPILIIENTINPASDYPANTSIISANGETYRVNNVGDVITFNADVSNLTGNYWVVLSSIGATSRWTNLYLITDSSDDVVCDSFAKVNNQWQNLIGTDIDAIQSGGETPAVPFEKEILHSIVQDQSGNSVPVSVTFTNDYQIAFICGLIADNVGTGAISVNALGGASELYGEYWERYVSAGIAIQLPSNKTLTGYFPYSDGGAYYDIFGAIGMSRLPSEYEVQATIYTSNISIELSKVYDHLVVFVGMDSTDSNSMTLAMNGTSIPLTVESEKFSRYSYHASEELTSDSATLNFTYSGGTVADNTIVVFAYNE